MSVYNVLASEACKTELLDPKMKANQKVHRPTKG